LDCKLVGRKIVTGSKGLYGATAKLVALAALCWASFAQAQAQSAPSWDELAAAARREGTLVVIGPAHQEVRRVLGPAFKKRFGVDMEYLGGSGGAAASRLRAERGAGLYTADVALAAIQTLATVFYAEKMLDPIKPLLVMPEVVDGANWKKGALWFPDPEQQYVLRLFSYIGDSFIVNTDYVKPEDMRTAHDLLLNPKWKGKIAVHDPRTSGTGSNIAAQLYAQLGGEDFLRKFYVDQKPMISGTERQITDWLLRGTYPIVVGGDSGEVDKMRDEGLPVLAVYDLPDMKAVISGGNGMIVVFSKAPHPAAAKLFVNWLASKEGLETYARASLSATTRNDIDEASFLPKETIAHAGGNYFDSYGWEFSVETKGMVRKMMEKMLR
jgi:iron(III) transport system substrate-binding protein